jgi:DNA-binding transcriptional regulator LsrR (DeoR family)
MKREERQQLIVNLLVEDKTVEVDDLAERFSVSKMTIHRDLDDLEQAGVLRKVRGGATIDAGTQFESDFRIRERQGGEAKVAMAQEALALVEPGEIEDIAAAGGVGEILGHFFNADGQILDTALSGRTLSASFPTTTKERLVALAGGQAKVAAIRAILRSRRLHGLITDERTARALLA